MTDDALIENVANEMDQLFRQRHDHADVICLLRSLVTDRIAALTIERDNLIGSRDWAKGKLLEFLWPCEGTLEGLVAQAIDRATKAEERIAALAKTASDNFASAEGWQCRATKAESQTTEAIKAMRLAHDGRLLAEAEAKALLALLDEVRTSGTEHTVPGRYAVMQIGLHLLASIDAAIAGAEGK